MDLYGTDSYGKRNAYHGWVGDRWERDFNGLDSPGLSEKFDESMEDKLIQRELKNYTVGIAGYALDDFIVNEISEDEYESESEDESRDSDDEEDCDDYYYWCDSDDE